jgi:PTH1 family peptidyl-tRNA hydrolase
MSHLDRDFIRVRVGIGKPKSSMEGADWVLSRFDSTTRGEIDDAIDSASRAIELILEQGVQKAMSVFNRRPTEESEEDDVVSPSQE